MGNLSAELLDGKTLAPIPGFSLADSVPLSPADGSTYISTPAKFRSSVQVLCRGLK